ncbi:MAG TPA: adenylyltransferase/cytidyltransferase family protein [Verrucomicrobiae bacterium]|nr:adenylyltransferase/cytidyltransferase family protein [Verrucomicrobiae bacterium]
MRSSESKIVSQQKLKSLVADHKKRGQTVVFANGCFDILHVGHKRYLEAARQQGDILIVAVNSDASARSLKGPGRPVLDESARARLVAALRAVDYVVLFNEPTVASLLRDLLPDVHAKGTDYSADTVPERAIATQLGIQIAIVGDPKNHSTRTLLGYLRKAPHG